MIQVEVLIVGGGPAGSACAWKLRQLGIDCLVLDRQAFPRFKPCAGWITPGVLDPLNTNLKEYPHGLQVFDALDISLRGVPIHYPTRQYAIRRYEFDEWLLQRSGAPVKMHTVKNIRAEAGGYVVDEQYQAQYLVGAGGTNCPVYQCLFKPSSPRAATDLIAALETEFYYPERDERCRLWFLENGLPGYSWYVPKAGGYINIGLGGSASQLHARGRKIQEHWDSFLAKLARMGLIGAEVPQPAGHSYYLRQRSPVVRIGNALITGDAVGAATRDMGEGIRAAVQSGLRAAEAIAGKSKYHLDGIARYTFLPF